MAEVAVASDADGEGDELREPTPNGPISSATSNAAKSLSVTGRSYDTPHPREVEGLKVSLAGADAKLAQMDQIIASRTKAVQLGIPSFTDIPDVPSTHQSIESGSETTEYELNSEKRFSSEKTSAIRHGRVSSVGVCFGGAQRYLPVSEKSFKALERSCRKQSLELRRPGWYAMTETKTCPHALPKSKTSSPPNRYTIALVTPR